MTETPVLQQQQH